MKIREIGQALDVADRVISEYFNDRNYLQESVGQLCEMTADPDPDIAAIGVKVLFPGLIERLNDSFDPAACNLYDRIFAQVIDFYRHRPEAAELDEKLREFGIRTETDLIERKERLGNPIVKSVNDSVKRVLLLSRVTIGADVMISSPIIDGLRQVLPNAESVFLGSRKLRELYGGDGLIRVREIGYERSGGVLSRLLSWLDVLAALEIETEDLGPDEFLLIDPDSRLTQLGLLPLIKDDRNYFYFESRSYMLNTSPSGSLGSLASHWIGKITGNPGTSFPFLALPEEIEAFGKNVIGKLRAKNQPIITCVSFGVGGNQNKSLSIEFEEDLVRHLMEKSVPVLDKGATGDERSRIDRLVNVIKSMGKTVVELNEENFQAVLDRPVFSADALTWDGGIGRFASLIAAGDEYIGYDSAGQHIAAALGVPALTIFVNSNTRIFAERWHPYGRGRIRVLETAPPGTVYETRRIFDSACRMLSELRDLHLRQV